MKSNNKKDIYNPQNHYLQRFMYTLLNQSPSGFTKSVINLGGRACSVSLEEGARNKSITGGKIYRENDALGSYLAGLIEGGGTFAIHNKASTAKKYSPMIIVVFKKNDLPLAEYLQNVTKCGNVYNKPNRGYVIWQIQDIVSVFTIIKLINGKMRTPKIEALQRTIDWLNNYIDNNKSSNLPITKLILSKIYKLEFKSLDTSSIDSNTWLSGFSDADGNFSINIHKRSNRNSTRIQLYYRMEIRQTYHRLDTEGNKTNYFSIMSIIANFLGVNLYSRNRTINDKQFYSYTVVSHNKHSRSKIVEYFTKYPLLSSKYLDFKDWLSILDKQAKSNHPSISAPQGTKPNLFEDTEDTVFCIRRDATYYLDEAVKIRKDFNKTRTTYNWDHLKNCYLTRIE
uniref:LAGLIDADG homing endonuclease n=1 Tax=Porodaedalea niemelaei TaxID=175858 RepID=UPI0023AA5E21|nr:LAGLIDADG homing endonuclease [Porodaedalea niemelaei]WCF76638.1 LAGLIDADG homing endonuclease [Porodaedalea niemelaei]